MKRFERSKLDELNKFFQKGKQYLMLNESNDVWDKEIKAYTATVIEIDYVGLNPKNFIPELVVYKTINHHKNIGLEKGKTPEFRSFTLHRLDLEEFMTQLYEVVGDFENLHVVQDPRTYDKEYNRYYYVEDKV